MSTDLELWQKTTEYLRGVLSPELISIWIEVITPAFIKDNCFVLNVPEGLYQTWIEDNYKSYILDALKAAGAPADLTVLFKVSVSETPKVEPPPPRIEPKNDLPKKPRTKVGASQVTPLNPTFTFENFVTGQSNSFTHAIAMAVSQAPGQAYNPLFIYGQTGIGKTHLMQAIGHRILQTSEKSVCYVSCETFFNEYIEALWKTKSDTTPATARTADFRNRYRRVDVLLVDDIQFLCGKDSTQTEFFHTFNELFNLRKQIIMTSDLPPKSLKGLEPRLVSRFEWGMVTEIESPDFETRLAILRYKNSLASTQLDDGTLTFIAYNIKSNVRNLEGALTRAVAYATLNNATVTTDVLQELLKDQLSNERRKDLTCEETQRATADYFDLRMTDMTSDTRTREIVEPRMIAMFLCRKLTSLSLPVIATSFKRTHATIHHASETIQARMQVDKNLFDAVKKITLTLGRDPSEVTH